MEEVTAKPPLLWSLSSRALCCWQFLVRKNSLEVRRLKKHHTSRRVLRKITSLSNELGLTWSFCAVTKGDMTSVHHDITPAQSAHTHNGKTIPSEDKPM